jgi:glutamate-1-semialdehyde 2,1-aminomutase
VLPDGVVVGLHNIAPEERFVADHGVGAHLYDASGNRYIDYVMGAGALVLGHAPATVVAAATRQIARGSTYFTSLNEPAVLLAEQLVEAIPCAERIVFTTTGSEATAYALRFARAATGRGKILKFEGAFHGNHDYSLFSGMTTRTANYPQGIADSGGIPDPVGEGVLVAPFNDLAATTAIAAENRNELAAIIVAPMQRTLLPAPGFLEGLRALCDEYGLLLIFDEVLTGFRLAYGGAQEYFGVTPDLAAYGKIIGGGLALGAVAGPSEILDLSGFSARDSEKFVYVNGSLHGNPASCAAGLATLGVLRQPHTYRQLNDSSDLLRRELQARLYANRVPAVITGAGSIWEIAFADRTPVNYAEWIRSDLAAARALDAALLAEGVLVLPGVRRFMSAVHGAKEIEETIAGLDRACRRVRSGQST